MRWVRLVLSASMVLSAASAAENSLGVFHGPPAPYEALVASTTTPGVLRTLAVEERLGISRRRELVRAPLFFAAGECPREGSVDLVERLGGPPLVVQVDDVRDGPDGGISRMHVWFEVDLDPWQRRTFLLVPRKPGGRTDTPAMSAQVRDGVLEIHPEGGEARIGVAGPQAGDLIEIRFSSGGRLSAVQGLAPHVRLTYGSAAPHEPVELPSAASAAEVEWSAGVLFTKVRARWTNAGATLEQVYRIGKAGRDIEIAQTVSPGVAQGSVLAARDLLAGVVEQAPEHVVRVPAGLRYELRAVQPYMACALVAGDGGESVLDVPAVIGGSAGVLALADGRLRVESPANLGQTGDAPAGTLRAFWTQATLVGCSRGDPRSLWTEYHSRVQPLVAVVDEPGISAGDLQAALRGIVGEMQPIGWRQQAVRLHLLGKDSESRRLLATVPKPAEGDPAYLLRGAQNAWERLSLNGTRRLREDEKSRASGQLDPYGITYTESAAAAMEVLSEVPPTVHEIGAANAVAARRFLGRTDEKGYPYIDCFNRALNMQMGCLLFGLSSARDDPATADFYRDLAGSPAVRAVYAKAQRPYSEKIGTSADYSDFLYQAICDFWLRCADILGDEDLGLHPLAYARYTDCIDVLADQYHGFDIRDADGSAGPSRANFWRAQPHTHRWVGWSCSPFIRTLETKGDLTGTTEAVEYCRMLRRRWKNWPDLTYYALAAMLSGEGLIRYHPPTFPGPPGGVTWAPADQGCAVRWDAVAGAAGYRIYRVDRDGGEPTWLNSPYLGKPAVTETRFLDVGGAPSARYFVTAVDSRGRESRWYTERP